MARVSISRLFLYTLELVKVKGAVTSTRRLMKIAGLGLFAVIFVFAFIGWPSNVIHHDGAHMTGEMVFALMLSI